MTLEQPTTQRTPLTPCKMYSMWSICDGTYSTCEAIGTLGFRHNNKQLWYQGCLYSPVYSNLVSGQRHILGGYGNIATLSREGKLIYYMNIGQMGGRLPPPKELL